MEDGLETKVQRDFVQHTLSLLVFLARPVQVQPTTDLITYRTETHVYLS